MHQTVKGFGFSDSGGFSPFGCHLTTSDITELQEKFLKYLPPNFEYDGVKGGGGSPPHHIGVQHKEDEDAGTRAERNNGCTIISYSEVENEVVAILKVGGGEYYNNYDSVQIKHKGGEGYQGHKQQQLYF